VGMYQGEPVLDLDYLEDSAAETDLNVVMTSTGGFIEVHAVCLIHRSHSVQALQEAHKKVDLARSAFLCLAIRSSGSSRSPR